jgi:cell division inhibitor SepF
MSTLHRLKAYFGMVPADELDEFGSYAGAAHGDGDYASDYGDYDAGYRNRRPSRWADRDPRDTRDGRDGRDQRDYRDYEDYYDDEPEAPARRAPARRQWAADAPVRGALAVDPATQAAPRTVAPPDPAPAHDSHPMSRITTLHPQNYNEARTIGEHYRDGIPVIMNLTAMDDADAKRLVDFAAGLAFALRGSIDKITTKVFLISPANVDVTAEDKRRIAEGSFLPPHFKHA